MCRSSMTIILKSVAIVMIFTTVAAALLAANFYVSLGNDPYGSFFARLRPSFYYRTAIILLITSILYIPVSYGITHYFLLSSYCRPKFKEFFYLFAKPILFLKAVGLKFLIWILRGWYRLSALFIGVLLESVWYVLSLIDDGIAVWNLTPEEIFSFRQMVFHQQAFMYFSVVLWSVILLWMLILSVRFLFCKYALMKYEELSVWEAKEIGLAATRGRVIRVTWYYLCYMAYYILVAVSFGLFACLLRSVRPEKFSLYGMHLVTAARGEYFNKKIKYG